MYNAKKKSDRKTQDRFVLMINLYIKQRFKIEEILHKKIGKKKV